MEDHITVGPPLSTDTNAGNKSYLGAKARFKFWHSVL